MTSTVYGAPLAADGPGASFCVKRRAGYSSAGRRFWKAQAMTMLMP
jgi:hypothetical protein